MKYLWVKGKEEWYNQIIFRPFLRRFWYNEWGRYIKDIIFFAMHEMFMSERNIILFYVGFDIMIDEDILKIWCFFAMNEMFMSERNYEWLC